MEVKHNGKGEKGGNKMNKRKGFFRLTLVLSLLCGTATLFLFLGRGEDTFLVSVGMSFIVFALIWVIYAFIRWIVIGFITRGLQDKSTP